jgi:hypothetical protein
MRRFRRSALKKSPRPSGQCKACYRAGLTPRQSRAFCRVCRNLAVRIPRPGDPRPVVAK